MRKLLCISGSMFRNTGLRLALQAITNLRICLEKTRWAFSLILVLLTILFTSFSGLAIIFVIAQSAASADHPVIGFILGTMSFTICELLAIYCQWLLIPLGMIASLDFVIFAMKRYSKRLEDEGKREASNLPLSPAFIFEGMK